MPATVYARARSAARSTCSAKSNSSRPTKPAATVWAAATAATAWGNGEIYIYARRRRQRGHDQRRDDSFELTAPAGHPTRWSAAKAHGGDIDIYAQNSGNLLFDSDLTATANATGGTGASGGGDAYGGDVDIYSFATLQVDGALTARADATGGGVYFTDFNGSSAGDGYGGDVDVYAESGLLTLVGAVTLSTDGTGGAVGNYLDIGGYGEGGTTRLFANAGGTVDLQSSLNSTAIGRGGGSDYYYSSVIGGDGKGGDVRVQAAGANASVTVAGDATLDASGHGTNGSGGDGTGGTVWADAFTASTAELDFQSDLSMIAEGHGGWSNYGPGGNAQGGQVLLQSTSGSTVTVGGDAVLSTDAYGGYTYDFDEGSGGNAIGGETRIQTYGTAGVGGNITDQRQRLCFSRRIWRRRI